MTRVIKYSEVKVYAEALGEISEGAQRELLRLWGKLSHLDIEDAREVLIAGIDRIVAEYGDAGALLAQEFLARHSPASAARTLATVQAGSVTAEQIEGTVRASLSGWAKGVPEQTLRTLVGALGRWVRHPARDYVIKAAAAAPKLRYARVPTGSHTCGFCIVMASRGFVYHSKATAGDMNRYHDHCDCMAVAAYVRPGEEVVVKGGADIKALDSARRDAEATIGTNDINLVGKELDRRDQTWIRTETPAPVEYIKDFEQLTDREQTLSDTLAKHGIAHTVLMEDLSKPANIDYSIANSLWEGKSPDGSSILIVSERLGEAASKWKRLGEGSPVRVVYSNEFGIRDDDEIVAEIVKLMPHIQYERAVYQVDEVLFVGKDASLKRLIRNG